MKLAFPLRRLPLAALFVFAASAQAQSFLFDFGNPATTADPLNFWNNVTDAIGLSDTGQLLDLVTTTNTVSTIDLFMVARFNGLNGNGTTTSSVYPATATGDSFFGNTETFGIGPNIFPVFRLASLDPSKTYDFTFYASRTGVTDIRETLYTVTGQSVSTTTLNVANNQNDVATIFSVSPSATGEINIALTPGPANLPTLACSKWIQFPSLRRRLRCCLAALVYSRVGAARVEAA